MNKPFSMHVAGHMWPSSMRVWSESLVCEVPAFRCEAAATIGEVRFLINFTFFFGMYG